jgi:hypothetical protein
MILILRLILSNATVKDLDDQHTTHFNKMSIVISDFPASAARTNENSKWSPLLGFRDLLMEVALLNIRRSIIDSTDHIIG